MLVSLEFILLRFMQNIERLTSIKSATIPRLELQAAVVSAKVSSTELDIYISRVDYWTDNMIVLSYIKNLSRRFKTFVANRVSTIHQLTDIQNWHHIQSPDNPADIVSRGSSLNVFNKEMWLNGPSFLKQPRSDWHISENSGNEISSNDIELKKDAIVNVCSGEFVYPIE